MGEKDLHAAFWALMVLNSPFGVAFNYHVYITIRAKTDFIHRVHEFYC
jgi:hypothetical protein